jgi:hypothetical protein
MVDKKEKILITIFLICMIPNIFVYAYHGNHEFEEASEHIGTVEYDHKGKEQFAEGIFFTVVTIGYIATTIGLLIKPEKKVFHYAILIGTVSIIVVYFASKTIGVPAIDGYDNWIIDDTTNWKDNVTKIAQQIFVIPVGMLLMRLYDKEEFLRAA